MDRILQSKSLKEIAFYEGALRGAYELSNELSLKCDINVIDESFMIDYQKILFRAEQLKKGK